MRPVCDEIIGPDMVATLGPKPNARALREPKARSFGLFLRDLQALFTPDGVDSVMAHVPALEIQELRDLTVTITTVYFGDL